MYQWLLCTRPKVHLAQHPVCLQHCMGADAKKKEQVKWGLTFLQYTCPASVQKSLGFPEPEVIYFLLITINGFFFYMFVSFTLKANQ